MKILWPLNDFMNYFKHLPFLLISRFSSAESCRVRFLSDERDDVAQNKTIFKHCFENYTSNLLELVAHQS